MTIEVPVEALFHVDQQGGEKRIHLLDFIPLLGGINTSNSAVREEQSDW